MLNDSDDTISPATDARLRRLARKLGYSLKRSRRAIGADNFGGYMIIDHDRGWAADGVRFDLSPDYVEAWLQDCEAG